MKKTTCAAAIAATFIAAGVAGAGGQVPGEEIASLSYLGTGSVEFEDPEDAAKGGEVSLQEAALSAPLGEAKIGGISLVGGAWAGMTRLDFRGHPELGAEELYGIAAIAALSKESDVGWSWAAMAMPGFYGDFRSGRTGEGKMLLHAVAERPLGAGWKAQIGLAYDTAFGDPALYPVGGAIWKGGGGWTVNAVFPSPSAHWSQGGRWGFYVAAQPAGDRWIVDDEKDGEQVFRIESWRAGAGAEARIWGTVWLSAFAGREFARSYEAKSGDRMLFEEDVDDAWFASIALAAY